MDDEEATRFRKSLLYICELENDLNEALFNEVNEETLTKRPDNRVDRAIFGKHITNHFRFSNPDRCTNSFFSAVAIPI